MSKNGITNFPYQGKVLGIERTGRYMIPLGVATYFEGKGEVVVYLEVSDPRRNNNDGRLVMLSENGVHQNVADRYLTVLNHSPFGEFSVEEYIAVFMYRVNVHYSKSHNVYFSVLGYGSFNMDSYAILFDGTRLFYSSELVTGSSGYQRMKYTDVLKKLNK